MYRYLGMKQDGITEVQRLYGIVARPLLYTPVGIARAEESQDAHPFSVEPIEAARLYEAYFDRDILTGERDVIAATLRLNWSADQAQAGRRAFDDHEVYLTRQEISIVENGDWAEVELHEIYRNRTRVRQEVVYYFSLPESAVITGVWLGNNPDRDARFVYRVAPRGAAQATYRNELRYWADPALAEQIGPRQYRLRIYPVQQRRIHYNRTTDIREVKEGRPLHVWLTYRVLASGRAWPLPRLAEKRNVYWDAGTIRLVNGEAMAPGLESWLPPSVPASSPVEPVAHRVDLGTGETVVARPVSAVDLPRLPDELRLGVVLDRSRSMATQETRVQQAMTRLAGMMDSGAVIDVYLTASAYRGESPSRASMAKIDLDAITYSGGQNAAELLLQFDALSSGETYDAILVLTDDAGYRAGNGDAEIPIPDAPLWMVHLGGGFPMGYDDATLEAIQASGGGTVASLDEALTRLAVALAGRGSASSRDVIDGYEWRLVPTGSTEAGSEATVDNAFAPFAARRLILATTNRQRNATYRLGALDRVHAIAVEHGIVTPYSSMLVLVDESQHELLDALEAGGDRFLREYEDVGETIPERAIAVGAVPEPEEWLLIALATAMLVWAARRRGIAPGHRRAA
jgi:putative PEP-CTERM system integral membrane protein